MLKKYILLVLLFVPLVLNLAIDIQSHANAYQVIISTTIPSTLVGQNMIFVEPLPTQYAITASNYYVINQYGYYTYSYLFSSTPPFLTFYEQNAVNSSFYVTYGNGITPQAVTTSVFSNLFNFYELNTTLWNASNVAVAGGVAVFGNNSHLWFQPSQARYNPTSVLFLYGILPSGSLSLPQLSYSGLLEGGSYVFFSFFTTTQQLSFPVQYLVPTQTAYVFTPALYSGTFSINSTTLKEYGSPPVPIHYNGNFTLTPNGLLIGNTVYQNPSFISENFTTTQIASYPSAQLYSASTVVGDPSILFTPSMINGSTFIAYINNTIAKVGSVQPTSLSLSNSPQMFVIPRSGGQYVTVYGVPLNSVVSISYTNGTTAQYTVSGTPINSVGPLSLGKINIPAGPGITQLIVKTPFTSVSYTARIGFTDFFRAYYVNITNNNAYFSINGTTIDTLGAVELPAVVVVGVQNNQNTQYILGEIYSENGQIETFIIPSPYTIYNIVPYVTYTTQTGQNLYLSQIGVTLANGLFYQLSGLVNVAISLPFTINSQLISTITSPGNTIEIQNGVVKTTSTPNSTSPLTIEGAQGYQLTLVYQNVQEQTTITQASYAVNIPSNIPVLVAVDPSTRTISINANGVQQTVPYVNQVINTTATGKTPSALNGTIFPVAPLKFAEQINTSDILGIITYYIGGALVIYLIDRNYDLTGVMWYGVNIWALLSLAVGLVFGLYALLPSAMFGLVLAYVLKYMNK